MKAYWDSVIAERKEVKEYPDFAYNHYYNMIGENRMQIFFMVPETLEDAKKAMSPKSEYLYEVNK